MQTLGGWYIKWNRSAFRHVRLYWPALKHRMMIPFEKLQAKCCGCAIVILESNRLVERSIIFHWQNLQVLSTVICWNCYIDCLVGYEHCHMSSADLMQKESIIDIDSCWEFLVESLLNFVIGWRQCRLLPGGMCMQHDSAHLYSSRERVEEMKELSIETSHTCHTRPCTGCNNLFGILTSEFSWFSF